MAFSRLASPPHAYSDTASMGSGDRGGGGGQAPEPNNIEDRGRSPYRHRSISGALATSLHAFNQQTPVRSYIQRSFYSATVAGDTPQSSTDAVRADTAELASRAVEDDSIYSSSPGSRFWDDDAGSRYGPFDPASLAYRRSLSRLRGEVKDEQRSETIREPEAIHEESEPSSSAGASEERSGILDNASSNILLAPEQEIAAEESSEDEPDPFASVTINPAIISQPHEQTPLIKGKSSLSYSGARRHKVDHDPESLNGLKPSFLSRIGASVTSVGSRIQHAASLVSKPSLWDRGAIWNATVIQPASYLPAVVLGLLLNVLDALSYGMILFPLGVPIFATLGTDGIAMFYVSCIVSQLVYSSGGSIFKGGIGSEMIEVVPFFHNMAYAIVNRVGEDRPHEVLATTILAYSMSSVITGLAFYLLGSFKLGALIGFFPRHILIGCIGGVGFFLVITGLEVSARLEGNFDYDLKTLQKLIELDTLPLWTIPLALAVILLIVKRWVKHSLTDAVYFLSIILVFYVVVAAIPKLGVADLRGKGWVFEAPEAGKPWWHFYTLYDFAAVDWAALAESIPAMLALTFFGLLHVPINVPALALTTGEDNLDLDRELRAHGYSNALSGLLGSIQNYLVYTNTVLFVRAGADSRVAGFLLAAATAAVLVIGPVIIGFIPIMVVGALIFFLGFDLLREALVDTWGKAGKLEYLTIVIIVLTMGIYDFVVGIGIGIILACVSFVLQTSQISAVRGTMPGSIANSTVRRHPVQRHYLYEVGSQIYVMRLAGFLFFGTIVGVEDQIKKVLDDDRFVDHPILFMVLDLSKVDGVDFSAAEAFTRINRILSRKEVSFIMCGFSMDSGVGKNLVNVGLFEGESNINFFPALNAALEYCENDMLKTFYQRRDYMLSHGHNADQGVHSRHLDVPKPERKISITWDEGISRSPRHGHLHRAAASTLTQKQDPLAQREWQRYEQPLQLILQTFSLLAPQHSEEFWQRLVPYLEREVWPAGAVLYHQGDPAEGFFLLQTGILKAKYEMEQGSFGEVIVAGATCGELPFFGEERRTSTTVAERESVTWVLRQPKWEELQEKDPEVARELLKISLKLTGERMEAITKYMLLTGT